MAEGGIGSTFADGQDELECSICCQQIIDAKLLKCLHTFCLDCLEKLDKHGAILCPICRTTTKLPEQGVQSLSSNFLFNRIIELVNAKGVSSESGESNCKNCNDGRAVKFYCFNCKHFLCEPCTDYHNKVKLLTEGHYVVELTKFSSDDDRAFVGRSSNCKRHETEELKFFCQDCDECICRDCSIVKHSGHQCMYLEDAVQQQKNELRGIMLLAKEAYCELVTRCKLLDERKTTFQQETMTAKQNLNTMAETLIQTIHQQVRDITNDLDKRAQTHIDTIASQKLTTLAKQTEIKDCLQFGEELLEQACNSDVMELKGVLKERLQDLTERKQCAQPSIKSLHINYIKNDSLFDAVKRRLGTLQEYCIDPLRCKAEGKERNSAIVGKQSHFIVTTGNEDREKATQVQVDRVTVSIRSLEGKPDIISKITVQGNGTHRVSYTPVCVGKYRIDVKVNEEEIAGNPFDLSVTAMAQGKSSDEQVAQLEKAPQPPVSRDRTDGSPAFQDTAEPRNDTGKLEVQTYETTPVMIRLIKKVYKERLNVISEEFSVNLSGSKDDTRLTIEPNDACNELKYNDACNDFVELYQGAIQGMAKNVLTIKPDKTVSKEEIKTAIRKTEETLPVLIEGGQESNWLVFGDRDSVDAARKIIHKQLALSSDTGKGQRKRAPATPGSKNDSDSDTSNVKIPAFPPPNSLLPKSSEEYLSKTGIKLSVFQGDITEQPVDAIVNAANTALNMTDYGGLGGTIVRKGGFSIQTEAYAISKKLSVIEIGTVVSTKAGNLPCKFVIHAVGPMNWPGRIEKKSRQFLYNAYLNSLECAKSLKLKSVAVPAIGTGAVGVPLEICATQLFNAIEQFWSKKGVVTDIRIVNLTDEADRVFKKEFSKRFKSGLPGKNPSKSKSVKGDSQRVQDETNTVNNVKPNISGTQRSPDNPRSGSASSPNVEKPDNNCVICMDKFKDPVSLDKCKHTFCKACIDQAFSHRKACPICGIVYGVLTGNQPQGTMNWHYDKWQNLPGYERRAGSIRIDYFFPNGTQGPEHPNPGQWYYGTSRTAYLPDCPEGREVLQLLKKAFDARLTFTIGTSVTTGIRNVVTWNDIHHKTNIYGGSSGYGYPDPTYLTRVKEELASKGIV